MVTDTKVEKITLTCAQK